jgi:hypothetical protein
MDEFKISLSITSSRRYDLFIRTLKSFHKFCKDCHLVKKIFHYDDSSSDEERLKMLDLLGSLFPEAELIEKRFSPNEFKDGKRHCNIMKEWICDITKYNKYVFHLEDDWEFRSNFKISDLINLIENNGNIAYVGVSQEIRNFPEEIKVESVGDFWKWHYDDSKPMLSNLFLDTKIMERSNDPGYWCYYINWPYFGFRPGIWDAEKLSGFEINCDLRESDIPFELDFAKRLSEKYVSYCTKNSFCEHIGDISSYSLNNSTR